MIIPVFEYPVTVLPSDIDEMEHANNVCYVRWMQEAAIGHSTYNGWTTERYIEAKWAWVARRHTIDYLQPAYLGDKLLVRTWVAMYKLVQSRRKYQFWKKSENMAENIMVASAETHWAFLSTETLRPIKIPQEVASCFTPLGDDPTEYLHQAVQNATTWTTRNFRIQE
ncbi:MAG: acyl-CoA thioesterase [Planctomycetaceae bacterium]|jgi:acyl-CoA thioester hydrolase|nr:acyl-CoA thioesterase [Planctomycetaceae bacterium]